MFIVYDSVLFLMCQTPGMGIVDNGTQLFPVCLTRHGAVGTEDEVGCCILKHLIDSLLGFLDTALDVCPRYDSTNKYRP